MVDKNTNAFRERFQRWKNGELVYDKGRPIELSEYGDGKDSGTATPPVLPVKHGDKVDTDQCAAWSNNWLRDNGYLTYGNAWNLKNVDTLYNGYSGIEKPAVYDKDSIERYNHAAADSLYKNFDSSTLDKSRPYAVNMFYNGSPAQEEAYLKGSGVTGTHTGVLTFNPSANRWYVTHNIHGTIHQEPFVPLQSGKGKYGVTAVYEPRKNTVVNKVKGLFGFEDGKDGEREPDEYDFAPQLMDELIVTPSKNIHDVSSYLDMVPKNNLGVHKKELIQAIQKGQESVAKTIYAGLGYLPVDPIGPIAGKVFKSISNSIRPLLRRPKYALSVIDDAEYLTNSVLKRKFLEANENVSRGVATDSDRRFIESMKKVINTKRGAVPVSEEFKQEMLDYYGSEHYRNRVLKNVRDKEAAEAFINDALKTIQNTPIERNPLHPIFLKNKAGGGTVQGVTIPTETTPKGTKSVIVLNENSGKDVINHEINHAVDIANNAAIKNNKRFPMKEIHQSKFTQNGKPYMLDDIETRTRAIALDKFLMKHPEYNIDDAYKSWYDPFHTNLSFNDLPIDAREYITHYAEAEGRNYFDNFYGLIPFLVGGIGYKSVNNTNYKYGKDSINIKPSKRGTFTAAAKRRGMTVSQLESAVLNNPSNYSEAMRKKAQFSRNARKWKH